MSRVSPALRIEVAGCECDGMFAQFLRPKRFARLILGDGPSGSGKTTATVTWSPYVTVLPKFKTAVRVPGRHDPPPIDTIPIGEERFAAFRRDPRFLAYRYGNGWYGFHTDALDAALQIDRPVLVTVRNNNLIRRLKRDYRDVGVISVLLYADSRVIADALQDDDPDVTDKRIARSVSFWQQYDPLLYDHTIVNNGSLDHYQTMLLNLLKHSCGIKLR